jgi:RNA polymerase sigma-70 factor (ECF subfamily)
MGKQPELINPTPLDPSIDDEELIRDTLAGKKDAFGHLIRKHEGPLLALALRILRNREEAEDVTQQVFVDAYRHLADFRHGAQFSTWLYSIALNRARNYLRVRKTRQHITMDDNDPDVEGRAPLQLPDMTPSAEQALEKQFNLEWIQLEVQSLSSEYKDIFTLHYFQDLPLQEIAKRLDRPLGTVKVYLHRARKDLYERWERQKHRSAVKD